MNSKIKNLNNDTIIDLDNIRNENICEFQRQVGELRKLGLSYIEAIITACDNNGIEPEDCKHILSPVLLTNLTIEAGDLNLIEQTTHRLPI